MGWKTKWKAIFKDWLWGKTKWKFWNPIGWRVIILWSLRWNALALHVFNHAHQLWLEACHLVKSEQGSERGRERLRETLMGMDAKSSSESRGKPIRCRGTFRLETLLEWTELLMLSRVWNWFVGLMSYLSCGESQTGWAISDRGDHGGAADGSWGSDSNHMHLSVSQRYYILETEGGYHKAYPCWNSNLYHFYEFPKIGSHIYADCVCS